MVLLTNENQLTIKNNHMLKCLEKKKTFYNIFVLPAKETLKENIIVDDNKNMINIADNLPKLTDRDINIIFNPK
jgi:hypothetical protein